MTRLSSFVASVLTTWILLQPICPFAGVHNPLSIQYEYSIPLPNEAGEGIAFDGTHLLVDSGGLIRFLDKETGEEMRTIPYSFQGYPNSTELRGMCVNSNRIAIVNIDGIVCYMDLITGEPYQYYDLRSALPNILEVMACEIIDNELYLLTTRVHTELIADYVSVFNAMDGSLLRRYHDPGLSSHGTDNGGLVHIAGELWSVYRSYSGISRFNPLNGVGDNSGVVPYDFLRDLAGIHPPCPCGVAFDGENRIFVLNGNADQIDVYRYNESIGDFVWDDVNDNGLQEVNEQGIPDILVNLFDDSGVLISTTGTDSSGFYSFTDLGPGTYSMQFVRPAGYRYSPQDVADESCDSDVNPTTGRTDYIYLEEGELDHDWDAGMYYDGVSSISNPVGAQMDLQLKSYPNPFNPSAMISYVLPMESHVQLAIHDLAGRLVLLLEENESVSKGHHQVKWHGCDSKGKAMSSGLYICRLETSYNSDSIPLILIK
ncbi:MAG: hypothetical protein GY835_20415 [bacterium]|nr:hypothetical protein [bacterium]